MPSDKSLDSHGSGGTQSCQGLQRKEVSKSYCLVKHYTNDHLQSVLNITFHQSLEKDPDIFVTLGG